MKMQEDSRERPFVTRMRFMVRCEGVDMRSRIAVVMTTLVVVATVAAQAPNTLTKEETAAGWKLLFDGKTFTGWRGFHREAMPPAGWVVENGTIKTMPAPAGQGGDIITSAEFSNFELSVDWKVSPGGNSGVKYLISEDLIKTGNSGLGFEAQVLDDDLNADAKAGKDGNRTAGSLYDLVPAAKTKVLKPVGDWNTMRIIVRGNHVEHWLNGAKVVEFEMGSPEFKQRIAESKFKADVGFGEVKKGHVLLQAHGAEVWFRNIKIRPGDFVPPAPLSPSLAGPHSPRSAPASRADRAARQ
jgi:3-keto-disaccharide hydrolase